MLISIVAVIFYTGGIIRDNITYSAQAAQEDRFVKIQDWGDNFVIYDKETKVQYYAFGDYNYGGGITVLVDQDGKPLLYEGE